MLKKEIVEKLNAQAYEEKMASSYYLSMAAWAEQTGFPGAAKYLYSAADEEQEHFLKFYKYVVANDGAAVVPAVETPSESWSSLRQVFEKVHALEAKVTDSINELAELALQIKDYATFFFLQEFVEEQQEALQGTKGLLDLFEIAGEDGKALILIDKQIGQTESH